jgi:hypothetical protein
VHSRSFGGALKVRARGHHYSVHRHNRHER